MKRPCRLNCSQLLMQSRTYSTRGIRRSVWPSELQLNLLRRTTVDFLQACSCAREPGLDLPGLEMSDQPSQPWSRMFKGALNPLSQTAKKKLKQGTWHPALQNANLRPAPLPSAHTQAVVYCCVASAAAAAALLVYASPDLSRTACRATL